jgi:sigma-B regulation protein RsbU (phosphoserine phosphatase)
MLAIRDTPVRDESTLDESITLKNDLHEVAKLSSFVKSITERLLTDKPEAKKLRLAVEEVVVNAMSYAYPPRTEGEITVRCVAGNQRIKFYIIDRGTPLDPTETGKADTTLSAEERPIGGLGLLLVRELTDTINYERIDDKNILTLTLNIEQ